MYPDGYTTNSTAVIVFLCFLFCGAIYGHIPHMDGIDERVVHVIQTQTSRQRGRRSADGFPPELRIDILRMTDVVLHRMYDVTDHVPILLKRGSRVEQFQPISKRIVAFYTNTTIEASFMTWHRQDSSELDVFGTFVDHEEEYLLQTDSTASTLARVPRLLAGQLDTVIIAPSTRDNIKGNNTAEQPSRNKRQTTQYEVEVMVVVDFAVYSFWFAKMNGTDLEKTATAMETIRQYYAFILNGVNLRYATVTRVSYTITALYAGIYIADTADAAPFDEPLKFTLSSLKRKALNAESVLSAFKEWAVGNLSSYNYDHAMMFTAYDMGSNVSGTFSNSVAGLAYLSGVCGSNRYSINEDHFNTFVNTVAAHELGHSIGANHDGENGNACLPGDNYVMTAHFNFSAAADKILNLWRFSSCSITYFTTLIDTLNTNNKNCLSRRSSSYNSSLADQYSSDIAGQLYPPDTQCQYIVGNGSYLMTSVYAGNYSSICTKLYCYVPGTTSSYYTYIAWEGTTCGNGKMCALGNCVLSANAPTGLNDTRIITIVIVLRITLPLEINLTNTNSAGFLQIKQEVELELTKIYSKRSGFLKVTVRKLSGSLEVDYDVEIKNTQQASTNFVKTSVDLVSGHEPLTIQNETVSPAFAIVSNITVTNATQSNADILCSLFVASSGGCPDLYSCAVVNGETGCVQDVKSGIPEMMIWVATGVSVFIIIVIVPVAVIITRCRRNRKKRKERRSSRYMEEIISDRHSRDHKRSELTTNALYGRHGPNSARLPSRSMPYHSNLGFDGTESRITLDNYPSLPGPGHEQIDRHCHDHKRSELTTNAPYGRHGSKSARLPSRSMPYHSNLGFDGTGSRVTLDHYPRLPGPGHKQM